MSVRGVIIVAAGSSLRFGQDKLMVLLQGRPLISWSLETFAAIPSMEEIVLVVAPGREASFHKLVQEMKISHFKKIKIVPGGKNRHESVRHGLHALSSGIEWVAIHDGARPLISRLMIESCFEKACEHGAAALAVPVTETLHRASANQMAEVTVDRTHLWGMQTPQVFRKSDLDYLTRIFHPNSAAACESLMQTALDSGLGLSGMSNTALRRNPRPPCLHHAARRLATNRYEISGLKVQHETESPTDEVSALLQCGKKVYLVENRKPNLKVTYPEDLALVSAIIQVSDLEHLK